MEHIEKIVIGLILFVATSTVAYLFKMRQLYAATPKLYKSTPIARDGSLCEIIIYNKGNQTEEDITASLDPDLKAELLASNSSELTLDKSQIKITRLHKGQDASAILLIENGILDPSKITSISSKNAQGKIFKKVEDVPPNFALSFIAIAFFIGAFPGLWYGIKAYESLSQSYYEHKFEAIHKLGWNNLEKYYDSELKESYSNQEFPIRLADAEEKTEELDFELYNKTAIPLLVGIDKKSRAKNDLSYFERITVSPMSKKSITIKRPTSKDAYPDAEYEFSIHHGTEFIYGITYTYNPANR